MARVDVDRDGRKTAWHNPVLRFSGTSRAPAEVVYDLLADLRSHLEWGGTRLARSSQRLMSLDAPPGISLRARQATRDQKLHHAQTSSQLRPRHVPCRHISRSGSTTTAAFAAEQAE